MHELKAGGLPVYKDSYRKRAISLCYANNPDIVILDLGLPDIDGIEVIEHIRSYSDRPIIVVSARQEEGEKIKALDLGADDYVVKPFYMGNCWPESGLQLERLRRAQGRNRRLCLRGLI